MLINLSNHPSARWSAQQAEAANRLYGEIVDLPFPQVDPNGDEAYVERLVDEYAGKVLQLAEKQPVTVHLMGEMTFCFALVSHLQKHDITCVASTTERIVKESGYGTKEVIFKFVQFRNYTQL